jgi:hypothetical protein
MSERRSGWPLSMHCELSGEDGLAVHGGRSISQCLSASLECNHRPGGLMHTRRPKNRVSSTPTGQNHSAELRRRTPSRMSLSVMRE